MKPYGLAKGKLPNYSEFSLTQSIITKVAILDWMYIVIIRLRSLTESIFLNSLCKVQKKDAD